MMAMHDGFTKQTLETTFFRNVDELVMQHLQAAAQSKKGKEELIRSTGIEDPTLVRELIELGIPADGLMAMRLVPLVLVAWAHQGVDGTERSRIEAEALRIGIVDGSIPSVLIHHWLNHRPPALLYDAWKRYTRSLLETMSEVARRKFRTLLEKQMLEVARASGGHFGFGKVSEREQEVIDMITQVLRS